MSFMCFFYQCCPGKNCQLCAWYKPHADCCWGIERWKRHSPRLQGTPHLTRADRHRRGWNGVRAVVGLGGRSLSLPCPTADTNSTANLETWVVTAESLGREETVCFWIWLSAKIWIRGDANLHEDFIWKAGWNSISPCLLSQGKQEELLEG